MTHWVERIVALVGDCIRVRLTGQLVVRLRFHEGGLRGMTAAREEKVDIPGASPSPARRPGLP